MEPAQERPPSYVKLSKAYRLVKWYYCHKTLTTRTVAMCPWKNVNFDHPDAFEWSLLSRHVAMLREGKSIEQPTYSYLTCTRQPETIHIAPREVIIIEGILALCDKKLRSMMDLKIFVDADPDERLIRVIQRDVVERGRTAEAVMERYTRILKPMHQQFIEPCKRYADLIVPEGGNNQVAIDILTMYIKKHLGS